MAGRALVLWALVASHVGATGAALHPDEEINEAAVQHESRIGDVGRLEPLLQDTPCADDESKMELRVRAESTIVTTISTTSLSTTTQRRGPNLAVSTVTSTYALTTSTSISTISDSSSSSTPTSPSTSASSTDTSSTASISTSSTPPPTSSAAPNPTPAPAVSHRHGLSEAATIGIGVGVGVGAALLILVIAGLCIASRRRRRRHNTDDRPLTGGKYERQAQSEASMVEAPQRNSFRGPSEFPTPTNSNFGVVPNPPPPPPPPPSTLPPAGLAVGTYKPYERYNDGTRLDHDHFAQPHEAEELDYYREQRPPGQTPASPPEVRQPTGAPRIPPTPPVLMIPEEEEEERTPLASREASPSRSVSPVSPVSPISQVSPETTRPSSIRQHS